MESPSLFEPWSPRCPGAGSMRATAALELYARMCLNPTATLLVDSFTRHFQGSGATRTDVAQYLALPQPFVNAALQALPRAILHTQLVATSSSSLDEGTVGDASAGSQEPLHFINYRTALPFAFAHVRRLLVALCRRPRVKDAPSSASFQRSSALEGVSCRSCSLWFDLENDLLAADRRTGSSNNSSSSNAGTSSMPTLGWCPACGEDLVVTWLQAVAQGEPDVPHALAQDRRLVRQAFVFLSFFQEKITFVDLDGPLTDPVDLMTHAELQDRAEHRADLALQFRAAHRKQGGSILLLHRLRLESSMSQETHRLNESILKLKRCVVTPPWLQSIQVDPARVQQGRELLTPKSGTREAAPMWKRSGEVAERLLKRQREEDLTTTDKDDETLWELAATL